MKKIPILIRKIDLLSKLNSMKLEQEKQKNELRKNQEQFNLLTKLRNKIPKKSKELFDYEIKWHRLKKVSIILE